MKNIFVFKTSVKRNADVKRLAPILNGLISSNDKWNFDLEDCDKILRVQSDGVESSSIEFALQEEGFRRIELKD